jgi:hypothetical protein
MRNAAAVGVLTGLLLAAAACGGAAHGTRPPSATERTQIGTVRTSSVDPVSGYRPEPQKLGLMHWGGTWEIVVGPGDWSGTCTQPSPQPLVDLYCR